MTLAIDINRTALLRLVAVLMGLAGMVSGGLVARLPRHVRQSILHVLRPAESAALRLIVMIAREMTARGVSLTPRAVRAMPAQPIPRGEGARQPVFALRDPRRRISIEPPRRFAAIGPQIRSFDDPFPVFDPPAPTVSPDDPVPAERVCRRLLALQHALGDLTKQGRRLVRMQARARARFAQSGVGAKRPLAPMRPGRPPGHRARGRHEVDDVLRECHLLALTALAAPDTS